MEFILLPLLLLAGLLATLDGSGGSASDGDGDGDGDGNDALTGDGTETVKGGAGDDLLTLSDNAAGYGGAGEDSLVGSGFSTSYGREGDDTFTLSDDARGLGGAGDDDFTVTDTAMGYGLEGDDTLSAEDNATIIGGAGNDVLLADDTARAEGGDGNDTLTEAGEGRVYGGAGDDTYIITSHSANIGASSGADTYVIDAKAAQQDAVPFGPLGARDAFVTIDTWEDQDKIAILLGTRDTSTLTFQITQATPDDRYTLVSMRDTASDGRVNTTTFQLMGKVDDFDLTDLVLYGNQIGDMIDWSEVDGNDTLSGTGSSVIYGGFGSDQITLSDSAVGVGGVGNDAIYAGDTSVAYGGAGADTLFSADNAVLNGGDGNDVFVADWSDDWATPTLQDFNPATDKLAILIGDKDAADITFRSSYNATADVTTLTFQIEQGQNEDTWPTMAVRLEGEHDYDPNDLLVYGDSLNDPIDWSPDPVLQDTITGTANGDTITVVDRQVGNGNAGNDTLIAEDESAAYGGTGRDTLASRDAASVYGGAGNDTLTASNRSEAYGGGGNDVLNSNGDSEYQLQPTVYGGDGDDTVQGFGELHGGEGNDLLRPDADGALFNGQDSYDGAVYGGLGDDTILGDSSSGDVFGSISVEGGAGNDLIQFDQGGGINAGDGNDIVITRLYDAVNSGNILMSDDGVHPFYVPTTLGAGADVLALDVLLTQGDVDSWSSDARSHVIADFNPAEDELALILPNADAGAFTASFTTHAPTGFMELRLVNDISSMTLLLQGVTSAFSLSQINIYADEAAVIARTPYATL